MSIAWCDLTKLDAHKNPSVRHTFGHFYILLCLPGSTETFSVLTILRQQQQTDTTDIMHKKNKQKKKKNAHMLTQPHPRHYNITTINAH